MQKLRKGTGKPPRLARPFSQFLHPKSWGTGCGRFNDAPALLCRPPSRSKTPPGSWPLRGPGLHSTGKSPILMGVQGKDPQWAAGASSMRPLCFADRPGRSKNPLGSSRFAPPRHPWWLSRGFDAAISRKRAFSGVGFLCHVGPCIGVFLLL